MFLDPVCSGYGCYGYMERIDKLIMGSLYFVLLFLLVQNNCDIIQTSENVPSSLQLESREYNAVTSDPGIVQPVSSNTLRASCSNTLLSIIIRVLRRWTYGWPYKQADDYSKY